MKTLLTKTGAGRPGELAGLIRRELELEGPRGRDSSWGEGNTVNFVEDELQAGDFDRKGIDRRGKAKIAGGSADDGDKDKPAGKVSST